MVALYAIVLFSGCAYFVFSGTPDGDRFGVWFKSLVKPQARARRRMQRADDAAFAALVSMYHRED